VETEAERATTLFALGCDVMQRTAVALYWRGAAGLV
jgi:hypothetical protein